MNSFLRSAWAALAVLAAWTEAGVSSASAAPAPEVDVLLWFDTEDLLLPADDDAALRLARLLSDRGIRATFKVVGEKARLLEQRGRRDVVDALRLHAIGYHSNWHSVHPTPTEYLADCGWDDGVAEFVRREGDGAADVRRIFGVDTLACYGQPGSSWAPQAVAALGRIGVVSRGVPCYVDEGNHVGVNDQPFWYAGALNVFHMGRGRGYTRMELHDDAAVEPAKQEVSAMAERLRGAGGGVISIFYHPCEWVHREFWDGVNFARGANPPRSQWRAPAQRPAEETDAAFRRFEAYIDHIRTLPGVRFLGADQLPERYRDGAREPGATPDEIRRLARRIMESPGQLNFITVGGVCYSPADQFELCVQSLNSAEESKAAAGPVKVTPLLGPDAPPPASEMQEASGEEFLRAVRDAGGYLQRHGRVPARVFIGAARIAPTDFLVAMADAVVRGKDAVQNGGIVRIPQGVTLATERLVAKDTPRLFGDWVIHRENFQAPRLMELARLQAWTLKPAQRSAPAAE